MPTIMIPLRLWKRFGLPGAPTAIPDDEESKLGSWSLVDVTTPAGELALFVNQRTLLAIVTPMGGLPELLPAFVARLRDELERRGVAGELVAEEMRALSAIALGKNVDRGLRVSVDDLARVVSGLARGAQDLPRLCDRVQDQLNQLARASRPAAADDGEAARRLFVTLH
jgi:hypothetical protein